VILNDIFNSEIYKYISNMSSIIGLILSIIIILITNNVRRAIKNFKLSLVRQNKCNLLKSQRLKIQQGDEIDAEIENYIKDNIKFYLHYKNIFNLKANLYEFLLNVFLYYKKRKCIVYFLNYFIYKLQDFEVIKYGKE
jgi:hypothetical protein